jgi:hypothetical protein
MKPLRSLVLFLVVTGVPAAAASCDDLSKLVLQGTTFTAQAVTAGSFTPPSGSAIQNLPAFCRVSGSIKPSNDSDIQFEVWMPQSGWNGKFQGVGNGGFAGSIDYLPLADAIRHGYAVASTDTGHRAGAVDGRWALGHPERVADFGYRAIHETTDKGKAFVRAYYGDAPKHSYFNSCSNGGRQALMEAQRFPADYDGIIAGAPANYWTHLLTGAMWNVQGMSDPSSYIPATKIAAIQAAALDACDADDGVKDGVIDNPAQCHFDPSKLLCTGTESDACLTAPQVAALKKVYDGPKTSKGEQLFPGYSVGGETGGGGWALWITGGSPATKSLMYSFGTQFYANMVFDSAQWDFHSFSIDRDPKVADDKTAQRLNATNADLSPFKKRGGKLILYHGWSDAAIPPVSTIQYYESVRSKMGAKDTSGFVRLFMAPGMQHCSGGPGPSNFGQGGVPQADAKQDMAAALEQWVEGGVAPEQIIAAKYKIPTNAASGVVRTRPLCAYPKVAHWNGTGSTDDAANFTCVDPTPARSK